MGAIVKFLKTSDDNYCIIDRTAKILSYSYHPSLYSTNAPNIGNSILQVHVVVAVYTYAHHLDTDMFITENDIDTPLGP